MDNNLRPFHLAFPVNDLNETKKWYTNTLDCLVGRESDEWVDFNMFGHQVVAHLSNSVNTIGTNEVDGKNVPINHFGVILKPADWNKLKEKLLTLDVEFVIKPTIRFKNSKGEQSTMFIKDPSGNILEFKSFIDDRMIFEK